ncbi:type III PLP-dependent enzyme [Pyxidicoccus xibeiensis]|uniref:type III PLP-dependent enzyme n=1 Tax=Pyxidicoccus xibeiensis TaxID=2906759 RepID=UPI0020A73303|nr:type III PLP-dependent enzyme [Pyxidicoccus xibeiensis]MCP3143655.1 type III PLP-dependent enzyme [Pyxidicoccus xibeiensis]
MTELSKVVQSLKAERSHPLCAYIYDLGHLKRHASRCIETLPATCRLFYAVKANSEEPILRALAPIVHGFEVASLGEVEKVRSVAPDAPILFGGPGKTDAEIEGALQHRVSLIHVESAHELRRVEYLAGRAGRVADVLLRVNLRGPLPSATLYMAGKPTQFGIDEEDIPAVIGLAKRCQHVRLRGFHFHSISNDLDATGHAHLVAHYLRLTRTWAARFSLDIAYVNAGGGLGVNYHQLDKQFDWDAFTTELNQLLPDECPPGASILFECGRYMTAACGAYAVEVLDIKRNHGKDYVIVRGGTHHFRLPSSWQHSHPFTLVPLEGWTSPIERPELRDGTITVVGQLCTPKDVLAYDVAVERVRVGDVLLFLYAGAYGWSISHHDFLSHPHPEQIFLEGGAC